MKPILISTVKEIVKGNLVVSLKDRFISDVRKNLSSIKRSNTLTFVWENETPDWNLIKRYSPCTIITSRFFKRYKSITGCSVILVNNVEAAYWDFVRHYRNLFNIPVIAVTGTSGKTTIKEMIKLVLSRHMKIAATVLNRNNCVTSLSYLLGIDESVGAGVFETAVGRPGDVSYACKHFKPTIGIITNIGSYHLDTCKTVENYIKAKAEMIAEMDDNGVLILNSDDDNTKRINLTDFKGRIIYFGVKNNAHFQAFNTKYINNRMEFTLAFQNVNYAIAIPGYGEHQVYNAIAAIAALYELGIGIKESSKILAFYKNLPRHLEVHKGINGSIIIDDTWNYNLSGLTAAVKSLDNIAPGRKKIAMLGGLGKLGENASEIISGVGNLIADYGIDDLIIIGDTAEAVADAVMRRGGNTRINIFKDGLGMNTLLDELLDENAVAFVKCYRNEYSKPLLDNLERIIVK